MAGFVTVDDIQGDEGGRYWFTLTRTGGTGSFAVQYATADGTATAPGDYTPVSGEALFGVGIDTVQVFVDFGRDTLGEPSETFFLNLSAPTNGAVISDAQATATIRDVVPPLEVQIDDITVFEGDSGLTDFVFTVTREGRADAFSINWTTEVATATPGVDYISGSDTLNFAQGEMSKTITVQVVGDTLHENPEHFIVRLYGGSNGAVATRSQGIATIRNDDLAAEDYAGDATTTGAFPLGSGASGHLETAGDKDWFRVTLPANVPAEFWVVPRTGTSFGPLASAETRLYDSQGNLLAGPGALTARYPYVAPLPEDYYLEVTGGSAGSYDVAVTHATGSGDDELILGDAYQHFFRLGEWSLFEGNDRFVGTSGSDAVDGGTGVDTMEGGQGTDQYVVDDFRDSIVEGVDPLPNWDQVTATTSYTLPANVEVLSLIGAAHNGVGNDEDNLLTGNGLDNGLDGRAGSDTIDGGDGNDWLLGGEGYDVLRGGRGADTLDGDIGPDWLEGGEGDDLYFVDLFSDLVFELFGGGFDSVVASGDYIMHPNVERLTLVGTAVGGLGNDQANHIVGNALDNGLAGGNGDDTIEGGDGHDSIDGQAGADSMVGGTGVDTYFVDNAGDSVVEAFNGGQYDTIWTTVSLTLPSNVEILILNGGALSIDGTGNDGATDDVPNLMLGNNAANRLTTFGGNDIVLGLDGDDTISAGGSTPGAYDLIAGGRGADSLTGGPGHDYFVYTHIDEAGDVITDFTTVGGPDLDILDLRAMWPTFAGAAGITNASQAAASGHLSFVQAGADTQVLADADGGGNSNVLVVLVRNSTASAVQTVTLI